MTLFKSFLLCLILALAGCGKSPEQTSTENNVENATSADARVDVPGKEVNISGETGEGKFTISSGEGAEIPKDFPDDVYIYQPSKIVTAMDMPEGGAIGLTTPDNATTIAETYKREMTDKNWSVQTTLQNGAQMMLVFEKEKRIANVTIGSMDDASQIMLTITKH